MSRYLEPASNGGLSFTATIGPDGNADFLGAINPANLASQALPDSLISSLTGVPGIVSLVNLATALGVSASQRAAWSAMQPSINPGAGLALTGGTLSIANGYYLPSISDQTGWSAKQAAITPGGGLTFSGNTLTTDSTHVIPTTTQAAAWSAAQSSLGAGPGFSLAGNTIQAASGYAIPTTAAAAAAATLAGLGNGLVKMASGAPALATAGTDYQAPLGFTPVPNTLTVNGHALSSNITLAYSDLSGKPTLGTAAGANIETTLGNDSSLPTGAAVEAYVGGLGFLTSSSSLAWAKVTGTPTTLSGYGVSNSDSVIAAGVAAYLTTQETSGTNLATWVNGLISTAWAGQSGVITGVTGSSPITATATGGAVAISMAQASGSANGFLASGDWSTFYAKQEAITAGAGFSLGGSPLTFGVDSAHYLPTLTDVSNWNSGGTQLFSGISGLIKESLVAAPSVAPTCAATGTGTLTGTYKYYVSFVTASGETSMGLASSSVSPSAQTVALSSIPLGGSGVLYRNIYRNTVATPAGAFLVTTIYDNTTTAYTDNIPDTGLGTVNQIARVNTTGTYSPAGSSDIIMALGYTPAANTITVNGQALSSNVSITATTLGLAAVATSGSYSSLIGTPAIPAGANPTATATGTAISGSAATFMRSDAAPAIQTASNSQPGLLSATDYTNFQTAYSQTLQWSGGSTNLVAATGRASLGLGSAAVANVESAVANDGGLPTGAAISAWAGSTNLTTLGTLPTLTLTNASGTNASGANGADCLTVNGNVQFNQTLTTYNVTRPVISAEYYFANPSAPLTTACDYHAVDLNFETLGANGNNLMGVYPFESCIMHNGTGTLAKIVPVLAKPRNSNTGTITEMDGISVLMSNDAAGTISTSYGIRINSIIANGGTWSNFFGLYFDPQPLLTSSTIYSIWTSVGAGKVWFGDAVTAYSSLSAASITLASGAGQFNANGQGYLYDSTASPNANLLLYGSWGGSSQGNSQNNIGNGAGLGVNGSGNVWLRTGTSTSAAGYTFTFDHGGGLTIPGTLTLTNNPLAVASGGTGLTTASANQFFAGPTTGSAAAPTMRSLVAADIPSLSATYLPLAGGTLTGQTVLGNSLQGTGTALSQAQILFYTFGGWTGSIGNGAGMGTDGSGNVWLRTGLSTSVAGNTYIFGSAGDFGPLIDNTLTLGVHGYRWTSIASYMGDFSNGIYVGGTGAPSSNHVIDGSGNVTANSVTVATTLGVTGASTLAALGCGAITGTSTISGTTLNGTTGINTGSGSGTQRIDASGNVTAASITNNGAENGAITTISNAYGTFSPSPTAISFRTVQIVNNYGASMLVSLPNAAAMGQITTFINASTVTANTIILTSNTQYTQAGGWS